MSNHSNNKPQNIPTTNTIPCILFKIVAISNIENAIKKDNIVVGLVIAIKKEEVKKDIIFDISAFYK